MLALDIVIDGFALLTPSERRKAALLALATVGVGALDTVALATAMPFIGLLVDPDALLSYPMIERLHQFAGAPGYAQMVTLTGLGCLVLVVASSLAGFAMQRRMGRFASDCQARLAGEIMGSLIAAPYAWFLTVNTTSVGHVFQRDVVLWARELVLKVLNVVRDVAIVVLPTLLVVVTTPAAGVMTIVLIGVLVAAVLRIIRPRIQKLITVKQEADARANLLAIQALAGVKDVKISGRGAEFTEQFVRSFGAFSRTHAQLTSWHQVPATVILLAGQAAMFAVALILWTVNDDKAALAGQLALLVLVTSRVLPAANRLASAATTFYGVLPAICAVRGLIAEVHNGAASCAPPRRTGPSQPLAWRQLELRSVGYTYPDATIASLRDITLVLEPRRAYGIVGPSGAGKSTLVDIVIGLLAPSEGAIMLDDVPLKGDTLLAWQRRVGYVPQAPFITDDTLAANVAFGVPPERIDRARLDSALEGANLSELVSSLPRGVDTPLGDRGVRLSGGQRQRIAIARALYDEADLLILDEATSALDTVSERAVQEAIEQLRGRVVTVTVAHRLSTVRDCDQIFVMDGGKLVAEGGWQELLATSPVFREMVNATNGKQTG